MHQLLMSPDVKYFEDSWSNINVSFRRKVVRRSEISTHYCLLILILLFLFLWSSDMELIHDPVLKDCERLNILSLKKAKEGRRKKVKGIIKYQLQPNPTQQLYR